MNKIFPSIEAAIEDIRDGSSVMIGGFGGSGAPIELIGALIERYRATGSPGSLTVINNNAGNGAVGIAAMIYAGMVAKMICSFPRSSDPKAFTERYLAGRIDLELVPQGTLAERIRAAGAGIPAFYTPAGTGTVVAEGKECRVFGTKLYLLETALHAEFALIKAWRGDRLGNLVYRKTARNFNPVMAAAAAVTIAEVEEIVECGVLDPDHIVTPGVYVDRIIEVSYPEKKIERRTFR